MRSIYKISFLGIFLYLFTAPVFADFGDNYGEVVNLNPDMGIFRFWMTDWSPDGKWLAFGYMDDTWIVPVEGGEPGKYCRQECSKRSRYVSRAMGIIPIPLIPRQQSSSLSRNLVLLNYQSTA